MVSSNYFYSILIICLHTVIWIQALLFDIDDFQLDLFDW